MSTMVRNTGGGPEDADTRPWWRYGMVWLVIGGPAAVVVAGIATAVIAINGADPVIREAATVVTTPDASTPAMQARNHAATPAR